MCTVQTTWPCWQILHMNQRQVYQSLRQQVDGISLTRNMCPSGFQKKAYQNHARTLLHVTVLLDAEGQILNVVGMNVVAWQHAGA